MSDFKPSGFYKSDSASNSEVPTRFISGLFYDRESAENAFRMLLNRGYSLDEITLLMGDQTRDNYFAEGNDESELGKKVTEDARVSSAIGGTLGAIIGGIAAIGTNTHLPGLGLTVAGPLAAALGSAGAGGLTGGMVGALIGSGIPEERAQQYEEGIRAGGIVIGVNLRDDEDADYYENETRLSPNENLYVHHGGEASNVEEVSDSVELESSSLSDEENMPHYKQINAWIAEREDSPDTPLFLDETYTLNFNVGNERSQSNLLVSDKAKILQSDIPDGGLDTEWVITTKNIRLAALDDKVSVTFADLRESVSVCTATFPLHVPKSPESSTRKIKITPLATENVEMDVLILAKNRIYRRFLVKMDVNTHKKRLPDSEVGGVAKITNELIYTRATEINPIPAHRWQKPRETLTVVVLSGDAGAYVINKKGTSEVGTGTRWYGNEKKIAPAIANLRAAAKKFCDEEDSYLNDINPEDLLQKLSSAKSNSDSFIFYDNADAEHQQLWDDKISVSDKLRQFAFYGYQLYETIFPRDTDLRRWIDELSLGGRITISWSEISGSAYVPNIPLGFMYVKPPPSAGQPIDVLNFLGFRYRLEYTAYDPRTRKSSALGKPDKTFRANCLYWGKQPNDEAAIEAVWQQNQWKSRTNQVFIPADFAVAAESNPMDALLKMLETPEPNPMHFLYLFCHCEVGDGSKPVLRFGSGKQPTDLVEQINLGTSPLADQPLVFINACTSAAGNAYVVNQLVETFFRRGCRAFLGTEIYMPIVLASRFALVFNSYFYREIDTEPISAGEAVYQSRLFLWHQYRNIGGIFYSYINQYDLFMADETEIQFG